MKNHTYYMEREEEHYGNWGNVRRIKRKSIERPSDLSGTDGHQKIRTSTAAFCAKCRELGYEICEMDLITAGEEFYATMRRSTNGGGENSPKLEGEDDFYELFFASLEQNH